MTDFVIIGFGGVEYGRLTVGPNRVHGDTPLVADIADAYMFRAASDYDQAEAQEHFEFWTTGYLATIPDFQVPVHRGVAPQLPPTAPRCTGHSIVRKRRVVVR